MKTFTFLRREQFLAFLLTLIPLFGFGQYVSISPELPPADAEITITFDIKQAKDGRASGLLGKTSDMYVWAWGGSDAERKTASYGPSGQSSFSQAYEPGKLTSLGNDRWQIKLNPRKYLNVGANQALKWMGVLVKNGAGTSQTEDFTFFVYEGKLSVAITSPSSRSLFVDAGSTLPLRAIASAKSNIKFIVGGTTVASASNADSLRHNLTINFPQNTTRIIKAIAETTTETAVDSVVVTVKPSPNVAELPAGLKDGINYINDNTVVLSLYAPLKSFVYAVGDFNNWQATPASLMNRTPDGKRYWIRLENLTKGQEYIFQYLIDGSIRVADPYCDKTSDGFDRFIESSIYPNLKAYPSQANGVASVLQTGQTPYNWKVKDFKRPAQTNLVIYELHIRDFVGTQAYKTVMDSLSYLKRMGINALELMPVMEFTGNDSWGYNPIFYLAPDKAYGTREALKELIDKCHENGIAVILDMVLNHADYENPYVKMYWDNVGNRPAANSPFFNQSATHPFSVFFDFNHESPDVKTLTDRVLRHWIEEYKMDGFRFDLSKGMTQTQSTGDDVFRRYDASRIAILKRMYDRVRDYDKTAYMILEHFAEDSEERELIDYGMMVWGNLNGDFKSAIRSGSGGFERLWYKSRGMGKPHIIGYMESHDEQRMMYEALNNGLVGSNNYNVKNLPIALDRAKACAAMFLAVPGPKMIWQFGELGYEVSIDQNGRTGRKPIRWEYQRDADRSKLYKVYSEIIKLKTTQAAFQSEDFTYSLGGRVKHITLKHSSMNVVLIANLDLEDTQEAAWFPNTGKWYDYFTGAEITVSDIQDKQELKAGEFHIYTSVKLPTPEKDLVPWAAYRKTVITSAEPTLNEPQVNVYPNPTERYLWIDFESSFRGMVGLNLTDSNGKSVKNQAINKNANRFVHQENIENLSEGVYFLRITQGDETTVKKVLKK
jgi:glycosidase